MVHLFVKRFLNDTLLKHVNIVIFSLKYVIFGCRITTRMCTKYFHFLHEYQSNKNENNYFAMKLNNLLLRCLMKTHRNFIFPFLCYLFFTFTMNCSRSLSQQVMVDGCLFAHPHCRASQYRMTFIHLSVYLWNNLSNPVFDGVGLADFKSPVNALHWPSCSPPAVLPFSYFFRWVGIVWLRSSDW